MNEPLDELYLAWLYSQVGSIDTKSPTLTYWSLFRQMLSTEFVWIVPNDDNRVEDGRDLRDEFFVDAEFHEVDPDWMNLGCSFLELLIGLSRRLSFASDREPRDWFWTMLDNIELTSWNDANYARRDPSEVAEILDCIIWRRYNPDGRGGLFPLRYPKEDQTKLELWYQLNEYLLETE